jgi:predicted aminopeptidase
MRRKLQLVMEARAFARDSLGLDVKESFTTFTQLRRDTLVLVLSGVYPDQLKQKTWWFPIVGRVPYKGYFDVDRAKKAADELRRDGFDAYVRPASAFSTLGWFNDPLVSTTLRADSIDLVNTVIHELTHNTYYAPGGATFNESFANFVGARGAAAFFRAHGHRGRRRRPTRAGRTSGLWARSGARCTNKSTRPSRRTRGIPTVRDASLCVTRSTVPRGRR